MNEHPLDHIVILAHDHEASLRFYETVLGTLGFVRERGHLFGRAGLFFDVRPATPARGPRARGEPGVDHFGFAAASRQQVDDLAALGRGLGEGVARIIEFDDGDYAVFLSDPDGVRIEVTCYAGS
jgi:catechol 2,3-dioxygenase-like lactoylglutathione lyase family enzyme